MRDSTRRMVMATLADEDEFNAVNAEEATAKIFEGYAKVETADGSKAIRQVGPTIHGSDPKGEVIVDKTMIEQGFMKSKSIHMTMELFRQLEKKLSQNLVIELEEIPVLSLFFETFVKVVLSDFSERLKEITGDHDREIITDAMQEELDELECFPGSDSDLNLKGVQAIEYMAGLSRLSRKIQSAAMSSPALHLRSAIAQKRNELSLEINETLERAIAYSEMFDEIPLRVEDVEGLCEKMCSCPRHQEIRNAREAAKTGDMPNENAESESESGPADDFVSAIFGTEAEHAIRSVFEAMGGRVIALGPLEDMTAEEITNRIRSEIENYMPDCSDENSEENS